MLLHELSLKLNDTSLPEIIAALIEKRKIKAGTGANAVAIIFPNKNYIYRVWNHDEGYEAFLALLLRMKSKHLVKVLSKIRVEKTKSGEFKYVKLEKLSELTGMNRTMVRVLGDVIRDNQDSMIAGDISYEELVEELVDTYELNSSLSPDKFRSFVDEQESFLRLCLDVVSEGHIDIHPGNIMQRGNELVVVDPNYIHTNELTAANILAGKTSKE